MIKRYTMIGSMLALSLFSITSLAADATLANQQTIISRLQTIINNQNTIESNQAALKTQIAAIKSDMDNFETKVQNELGN